MVSTQISFENIDALGDIPSARFGHTITVVSPQKAVLFGGATGSSDHPVTNNDTYIFTASVNIWAKLTVKGVIPPARISHASATIDTFQMVLYGGTSGGRSEQLIKNRKCFMLR